MARPSQIGRLCRGECSRRRHDRGAVRQAMRGREDMAATSGPTTDHPRGLGGISELRAKWGWFVALGVLMLIAGVVALGNELLATVVTVYYVGAMMLVAGIFEIIHAFGVKSWGRFFWWLISGIVYALAGVF